LSRGRARQATVRLYGSLNDFLPPARRGHEFVHPFNGRPTVKDVLESLGVPHVELDVVLVDGVPVLLSHQLEGGERLAAYPAFHTLDVEGLVRVAPPAPEPLRFVLDVGLGRLAGLLRMLGFDALWRNDWPDALLARVSRDEVRYLLSRDVGLLKRAEVVHGYFPRATGPEAQLVEVARRFRLGAHLRPFSRCLECNVPVQPLPPAGAAGRVPGRVQARFTTFHECPACGRVYWEGSHHARMQQWVARLRQLEQEE
jgi:uncharacterized protein with PIN domain